MADLPRSDFDYHALGLSSAIIALENARRNHPDDPFAEMSEDDLTGWMQDWVEVQSWLTVLLTDVLTPATAAGLLGPVSLDPIDVGDPETLISTLRGGILDPTTLRGGPEGPEGFIVTKGDEMLTLSREAIEAAYGGAPDTLREMLTRYGYLTAEGENLTDGDGPDADGDDPTE